MPRERDRPAMRATQLSRMVERIEVRSDGDLRRIQKIRQLPYLHRSVAIEDGHDCRTTLVYEQLLLLGHCRSFLFACKYGGIVFILSYLNANR